MKLTQSFALIFVIAISTVTKLYAADAVTTEDPNIKVDHLDLLLDPLTKSDLEVEVNAWQSLLKNKVQQISTNEIASRIASEELSQSKEETSNSASATETQQDEKQQQKDEILTKLTKLREEKTALLERFGLVLEAYEDKGGDAKEYEQYARAVEGIKVEVTDTSATWTAIKGWVTSREGGIKFALNTLKFLAILLAFYVLSKLVGKVVRSMTENSYRLSSLLKSFINTMAQRTIMFIGLLVALSTMGVEVGALLALIGGGAFIIGFALQDTLGNFAAGLMLLFYRPFDEGDIVEVGGVSGKVDKVSLVSTTIRTFDNKVVLVPNKQVWGQVITNATASDQRRVDLVFGISYQDDIDKAKALIEDIVQKHELVLKEPEPVVELHTLGESSVDFVCRPWTRTTDYWRVYWDITKQVKQTFDAQGVSIPFPQRDVHVHYLEKNSETQKESKEDSFSPPTEPKAKKTVADTTD